MLAVVPLLLLLPGRGDAVVVLDSTWRAEGGGRGHEADGFGAHIALANQPQFAGVMSLASEEDEWGEASGTWIGNDDRHGYILSAAHVFDPPSNRADSYFYRTGDGTTYTGERVWVHPRWNGDNDNRAGFDLAIVRLTKPVRGVGNPPKLYAGHAERGKTLTFVGYGNRGIGSKGEDEKYYNGGGKAAAQGVVDEVVDMVRPFPAKADAGNYLSVTLPREDGRLENPFGGKTVPVSRYAGLLGSGDSGGSAWLSLDGTWVLAGVNVNGTGDTYGETSSFMRVSGHQSWIAGIFPGVRFQGTGTAPSPPISVDPPTPEPVSVPESLCRPGQRVEVLSEGDWYPAKVRRAGPSGGRCPVRFDGYGAEYDESVPLNRLRPRPGKERR